MLVEDVFVRRHSYSSVFADLTSLQNLDDEEDGTGATGVIAFDTSRLGLWLSELLDGSIVLLYLVLC